MNKASARADSSVKRVSYPIEKLRADSVNRASIPFDSINGAQGRISSVNRASLRSDSEFRPSFSPNK